MKKQYNSKIKHEYLDQDYIEELSEQEKDWLNKFNEEYYGASLDYKQLDNNFHNNERLKKDCTDRNNARNRCVYGLAKATGRIIDPSMTGLGKVDETVENQSDANIENYVIDYLDSKDTKTE